MPGRKQAAQPKLERRSDEEGLYYIIERDLDRDTIFRENEGWIAQETILNAGRMDYVIKYGKLLIGIEAKAYFPKIEHFEQASKYSPYVDALFLAYPSNWAGQALLHERESKEIPQHWNIGNISLSFSLHSKIFTATKAF